MRRLWSKTVNSRRSGRKSKTKDRKSCGNDILEIIQRIHGQPSFLFPKARFLFLQRYERNVHGRLNAS